MGLVRMNASTGAGHSLGLAGGRITGVGPANLFMILCVGGLGNLIGPAFLEPLIQRMRGRWRSSISACGGRNQGRQ